MRISCLILLMFVSLAAASQKKLRGVVKDAETHQPIAGASVFLNNTSVGTATNISGEFELYIPNGKYELITTSISYETGNQTVSASDLTDFMTITLKPKPKELSTVVVEAFEKDGWKKWGNFFIENFIGTSSIAAACKLKNREAIKFRFSKMKNELSVVALEPLIIENPALGYTIQFQLESFTYSFKTRYRFYQGYPLFIPMKGGNGKERRWEQRREEVYHGSIMHFMRSVYLNTLAQEGFQVQRLQKLPNTEKARVKTLAMGNYRYERSSGGGTNLTIQKSYNDSSEYYERVLAQPDEIDIIGREILTGDSIAYAVDSTVAGMAFNDYLLVLYTKKPASAEFRQLYPKSPAAMISYITLINNTPIEILANGMYYNPMDILHQGYWSWSEKISTLLPLDYKPPVHERTK